jgi:hypothetical protein
MRGSDLIIRWSLVRVQPAPLAKVQVAALKTQGSDRRLLLLVPIWSPSGVLADEVLGVGEYEPAASLMRDVPSIFTMRFQIKRQMLDPSHTPAVLVILVRCS